MIDESSKLLFNYGVAGVVLAVVLSSFLYGFKRLLDHTFRERRFLDEKFERFMEASVKAQNDLRFDFQAGMSAIAEKVISAVYASASTVVNEIKDNSRPIQLDPPGARRR